MKRTTFSFTVSALVGAALAIAAALPGQSTEPAQAQAAEQQARHRQPDPARQVRVLTKRLNLTAAQQNQILPVLTDRVQQMEAVRSDNSLSPRDRRAKMQALRQDSNAKITAVLTPGQKQTYEQMQQQARERGRQTRQGSGS